MSRSDRTSWFQTPRNFQQGGVANGRMLTEYNVIGLDSPVVARLRRPVGNMPYVIFVGYTPSVGVEIPFVFRQAKDDSVMARTLISGGKKKALNAALRTGTRWSIQGLEALPPEELLRMKTAIHPVFPAWEVAKDEKWLLAGERRSGDSFFLSIAPASTYTDTLCELMSEIQRHLLEDPIDNGATWSLWTQEEVIDIFNERLRRFILETSILMKRATLTVTAGTSEYQLPEDMLDLRRISFRNGSAYSSLQRMDSWAADNGVVGWEATSATPYGYYINPLAVQTVKVVPSPVASGSLDLIYVYGPELFTTATPCAKMPIPNMFTPYIKWGVMADMLTKEGPANDPVRAEYCELRYQEGVELAKLLCGGS